jgi:hypothetical protein
VEVGNEVSCGERSHGALKDNMMQVLGLPVAYGAECREPVVIPGLVGGEVAFVSSELVEATACEFVQLHIVVWYKFCDQIIIFWCGEGVVPVSDTMVNCLGFCNCEGDEEVPSKGGEEQEGD